MTETNNQLSQQRANELTVRLLEAAKHASAAIERSQREFMESVEKQDGH